MGTSQIKVFPRWVLSIGVSDGNGSSEWYEDCKWEKRPCSLKPRLTHGPRLKIIFFSAGYQGDVLALPLGKSDQILIACDQSDGASLWIWDTDSGQLRKRIRNI